LCHNPAIQAKINPCYLVFVHATFIAVKFQHPELVLSLGLSQCHSSLVHSLFSQERTADSVSEDIHR
jgi:hypothetical protein